MGAKRISEHDLVFTGRNVPLSEIARASGIGITTLKNGILSGVLDFGMRSPAVRANSIAITALTG